MNWKLVRLPLKSLNLDASVVQRAALKSFLGRLGGRGKVRPNAGKKMFFLLFVSSRIFFCLLSLLLFLALGGGHSSLSFVPTTVSPPTKLHTRVAHIPPPPPAPSAIVPLTPYPLKLHVWHHLTLLFASLRPYQQGLEHNHVLCCWRRPV